MVDSGHVPCPSGDVLVLNCGSSSVKIAIVDAATGARRASWLREAVPPGGQGSAVEAVLRELTDATTAGLIGVGHRVVHGGPDLVQSTVVDDRVRAALGDVVALAPLHLPANLAGIDAASGALSHLRHVAVFDTGFHHTLPPRAYRYAVPQAWYDQHGARRYGFHGISCRYVTKRTAELLDRPLDELRLVVAHLGGGCSATAVRDGLSVDTTMGFTPLEGLVMGTRSGDIDPGLLSYLAPRLGLALDELVSELNRHSGLLGLSGVGDDVRDISDAAEKGSSAAALALDVYCYRLAKTVAALAVPLERLDALVFTAGTGEHSAEVRSRTMSLLGIMGIQEDSPANAVHGGDTGGIISNGNGPLVLVVPTDEERVVAADTATLLIS